MKKILFLGGSCCLISVFKAAKELGYYVINCDYNENSPSCAYADEFHKVSVIDKESLLALAKEKQIDGIMSFACDLGVVTAAYVAQELGLPSCGPYESVKILQNKNLFRAFLKENGFNVPRAKAYENFDEAENDRDEFVWPVIVKPVDSAGSKGVSRVDRFEDLHEAFDYAKRYSTVGDVIIEQFLEPDGHPSDTDCFSVNGKLEFVSFSNQLFDAHCDNPYAPAAYTWPSNMAAAHQEELAREIQRLLTLLEMRTAVYNVETRVAKDGKPYIMELTPRGGGNRLSEMLRYATGVDLIANAVKSVVGETDIDVQQKPYVGEWGIAILHSAQSGVFDKLVISEDLKPYVIEEDLWVKKGQEISSFTGGNASIGTLVIRMDDREKLQRVLNDLSSYVNVVVD